MSRFSDQNNGRFIRDGVHCWNMDSLMKNIHIDDLKGILINYVDNESSSEKVARMYYGTRSVVNKFRF